MRVDQLVSSVVAVEVAVFICLHSSCNCVTEVVDLVWSVGIALPHVIIQTDRDFVEAILLYSHLLKIIQLVLYPPEVFRPCIISPVLNIL